MSDRLSYMDVLNKVYGGDLSKVPTRLLCLDPGETTGWCLFEHGKVTTHGQANTVVLSNEGKQGKKILNWKILKWIFEETEPTHVVCENYRIYAHKLDRHSFSEVETLRLIGGIDMICYELGIPIEYQMAVQAKNFVTDERLKLWDFWKEGMRHSRDAIRHGIYYLVITHSKKE